MVDVGIFQRGEQLGCWAKNEKKGRARAMQAGLLGHEEQPPELTLRNLHRERRKRGKRWSQVFQLSNVSFETGG